MSDVRRIGVAGLALGCVWLAGCVWEAHPYRRRYYEPRPVVVVEPAPPPGMVMQPAEPGVIVDIAPPADYVEVQPDMPGPDFIWIPGFWGWEGNRHVWMRGGWNRAPHRGAVWLPHRWENRGGHWHLEGGHWR